MFDSIVRYLEYYSVKTPDRICIAEYNRTWNYKEFWELIAGFSRYLLRLGLKQGECVPVVCSQNAAFLAAGLAIQLSGGIFVPLEKNLGAGRIEEIVNQTDAHILIAPKDMGFTNIFVDSAKVELCSGLMNDDVGDTEYPRGEQTAKILFTTGTTGKSKGVVISHAACVAAAENAKFGIEMPPDNIEIIPLPLNHAFGLRRSYANIINGSCAVLTDGITFVSDFFDMIERYNVNSVALSVSQMSLVLRNAGDEFSKLADKLKYIQLGASDFPESMRIQLCEQFPRTRIYNFYGTSEAACSCAIDLNSERKPSMCVGKPTRHTQIIFTDEYGAEKNATAQNPGIIAIKGAMTMDGYYQDEDLTRVTLRDGYIYTNDLGYMDEEKYIYVLGRKGDVINIGGNKVNPAEIEDKAIKFEGIEDCACIPVDDELLGLVPKLFVVMKDGYNFSHAGLHKFLSGHLESYKIPKLIVEIDNIPKTYNGKVLKNELKVL